MYPKYSMIIYDWPVLYIRPKLLVMSIKTKIVALLEINFYVIYKNILSNYKLKMVWLIICYSY